MLITRIHCLKALLPLLTVLLFFITDSVRAQVGKDGGVSISTATIVNDYTALTADAAAGSNLLNVMSASLNANFSAPLATGDLIFIIQMQGASMNTSDDSTYGALTSINNCGNYEFAEVASVPFSTQIVTSCALKNSYTAAGKVQVIRVPRFSTLTVNAGGSVICPAWNGITGGAVIVESQNAIVINGSIDATAKGFRGGQTAGDASSAYGVLNYRWTSNDYGGEKGEGVAGAIASYDAMGGRYCQGAPVNGGGGGSGHNAGGGGGANCGSIPWTGRGNPDLSNGSWASAWNLEYSGFASSTSSGGGKGGYSFSGSNQNALSVGPMNPAWGGDLRRDNGGRGGRPLDYSTGRIFMGGGGGAGDQNDFYAGSGGNGGGIVYVLGYSTISGSGSINANGANGSATISNGTDGAGGAGAGGAIIVDAKGVITSIVVNANGGRGGNQVVGAFVNEAEGPGGGGGGGYIAMTSNFTTRSANGGSNGTTNSNGLSEFTPNGATKGGAGLPNETVNSFQILTSTVYVCPNASATLSFTTVGTVAPGTFFEWYDQPVGGTLLGTGTTFTTPVLSSGSFTYYIASCPGTGRTPVQVEVSAVSVSTTATTVCTGSATDFTGNATSASGSISTWSWDFGNSSGTSSSQNASYTYPVAGNYTATLTVTDASGCTASASQAVVVSPAPVISFSAPVVSGCGPLNVSFTNNSTGATSYVWNFGDGSFPSAAVSPSHVYSANGTYTVTLTGSVGNCTSTSTQNNYITVLPSPRSSFTTNSPVCAGSPVVFTNASSPNGTTISGYTWNYGDGSPNGSGVNSTHTYSTPGTYNVTLTANASCNDDTTIAVTVSPEPVASFTSPNPSGCAPLPVVFNNSSTGASSYSWNFGDGGPFSSTASPTHNYFSPGTYTVTLIATQGNCRDTLTRAAFVTIGNAPAASFSASATSVCVGDSIRFQNLTPGTVSSYTWDFGDGGTATTSTAVAQSHLYSSPGSYVVELSASANGCIDDTSITINVSPGPLASFSTSQTSGCGNLAVSFTNSTSGSPSYIWNFGDGNSSTLPAPNHTYTNPGAYDVTLIATQGSCSDTLVRPAYINLYPQPVSSFSTSSVCQGDSVHFTNLSNGNGEPITNYTWNFGDGSFSSQTSPVHFYSSPGTYAVLLSLVSTHCTDDTTISVSVTPGPVVSFSPSDVSVCGNEAVTFTNNTTGAPVYSWNFGDGSPLSSAEEPVHTYSSPGVYSVTLIATQGSCADTLSSNNLITVAASPLASFSASSGCLFDSVEILNTSSANGGVIISQTWNFGDGTFSSDVSPSHLYTTAGTYQVELSVATAGCTDDTTISVQVDDYPVVNFASSTIRSCDSVTVNFNNLTSGATTYSWNFGDGNTSTDPFPVHHYSGAGTYSVLLTATTAAGCSSSKYAGSMVIINSSPVPDFTASRTALCPGECVSFTDLTAGANTSWNWQIQGGNPSASIAQNLQSVCFGNIGQYTVTLTVSNGSCTASATKPALINVVNCNAKPEADFISSDTVICGSSCINFVDLSLNSVSWSWQFPGGTPVSSSIQSPSNICYTTPGVYPVTLIATNPNGSDTMTVSSFITVSAAPAIPVFTQNGNVLTSSPAITYQWHYNNIPISGAVTQQYTATLSGPYSVRVTDASGCSATSAVAHVSLVGIDDLESAGFVIYPNPANEELFIHSDRAVLKDVQIDMFDLAGRNIRQILNPASPEGTIWRIDLNNIAAGMYVLRLTTGDGQWKAMIVKN